LLRGIQTTHSSAVLATASETGASTLRSAGICDLDKVTAREHGAILALSKRILAKFADNWGIAHKSVGKRT